MIHIELHREHRLLRLLGALLIGLMVLAPAAEAWAQGRPSRPSQEAPAPRRAPVSGKVGVQILVAYAHNEDKRVDPELRSVMEQMKHFRFSGYRLLEKQSAQLGPTQETSLSIPGGKKLRVELLDRNERQARIRVRIFKGSDKVFDTTVSVPRNKTFLIGGPRYEKGNLVMPLTVSY